MKGRKKKNYNPSIRAFYCGDTAAMEICKKKKINISAEITKLLQRLAYGAGDMKQAELMILDKMNFLQQERNLKIKQIENKYAAEIRGTAQDLAKVQAKIRAKEAEEKLR